MRREDINSFNELVRWLEASEREISDMTGVSLTYLWALENAGCDPDPRAVRKLRQTHALLNALLIKLGESSTQRWLESGAPSRKERLISGDLNSVQIESRAVLFLGTRSTPPPGSWVPDDEF